MAEKKDDKKDTKKTEAALKSMGKGIADLNLKDVDQLLKMQQQAAEEP